MLVGRKRMAVSVIIDDRSPTIDLRRSFARGERKRDLRMRTPAVGEKLIGRGDAVSRHQSFQQGYRYWDERNLFPVLEGGGAHRVRHTSRGNRPRRFKWPIRARSLRAVTPRARANGLRGFSLKFHVDRVIGRALGTSVRRSPTDDI